MQFFPMQEGMSEAVQNEELAAVEGKYTLKGAAWL